MSTVNGFATPGAEKDNMTLPGMASGRLSATSRARVLVSGSVGLAAQADASRLVSAAFESAGVCGADVRLRLTWDAGDRPRPAVAQVNADVDERLVRAQVSADDLRGVVEAIVVRVSAQLAALSSEWTPRVGPQEKKAWPSRSARRSAERELVRAKSFTLGRLMTQEAVHYMDALDYNFYLYESAGTGEHCLVYRIGPTGYRVSTPNPQFGPPPGLVPPLTWQGRAPTHFTLAEALEHLNRTDFPFVFFFEGDVARVMYRRYDGHYGLISGRRQ